MFLLSRFLNVKTFVLDMDGVLTDGGLTITADGEWIRRMSVKDGYALQLAVKTGYTVIVISGSTSTPVADRLHALGVHHVYMGIHEKAVFLRKLSLQHGFRAEEMLFMGDDIPDLECMRLVALPCCPADAVSDIRRISAYISPFNGGYGCVRDVIEKVLKINRQWSSETTVPST